MKEFSKNYKNLILRSLKIIFLILTILFIIIHSIKSMFICNYSVTYIILLCIFIFYLFQTFKIQYIVSLKKRILCSIFLIMILFWITILLIFEGILLLFTKSRVTIDSYRISDNNYLRTISYNSDEISDDIIVDIIYEHEFVFGITCYTPIDSYYKEPDYSSNKNEKFNHIRKTINLKKVYSKINKKPIFCGINLSQNYK